MSLPVPLAVRLSTSRSDRIVTREVRDLSFRSVAPGGFASATVDLDRPVSLQPDEIAYFGRMYIYDRRNGNTVWEGQLEDPRRTAGSDGQVWQLAGIGPSAHVHDRTVPLIYVDRDMRALIPADAVTPGAQASVSTDPGDPASQRQALVLRFPQQQTVAIDSRAVLRYDRIRQAGQKVASINYSWDAGRIDANFFVRAMLRPDGAIVGSDQARSDSLNTAGGGLSHRVVGTDWVNGKNVVDIILISATTGTVADDTCWASVATPVVRAMLYNKSGIEITTGYTADTVLSSEVVADLLGRLLTRYDGANASIATTSFGIEQLAYPDAADPGKVLSDLMTFDPAYFWAAWESTPSTGRYRFEWSPWPSSVRYEADVRDGFDSPGSAGELYNAVRVRYRNEAGEIRTIQRTQTVQVLTDAGVTREGYLDLGDTTGVSLTQAQRAGDQYLAEHQYAPNAGRLHVARPVLDMVAGRMVMPWEIRPGTLIRVRGVLPRVDALNASARDGVSVFRVVGNSFRASSASADLDLDSYAPTVARALADLQNRPVTARR